MKLEVAINVMPLKDLLDPQGKAVLGGLHKISGVFTCTVDFFFNFDEFATKRYPTSQEKGISMHNNVLELP